MKEGKLVTAQIGGQYFWNKIDETRGRTLSVRGGKF